MTSARWDDDEALLADLRAALDAAAVPEHLTLAASAAYTWRTIDEELAFATLVFDSALQDEAEGALVRGAGPRTLLFDGDQLSVEIEVTDDSLVGQLIPPQPGRVTLVDAGGTVDEAAADEVGCFVLHRSGTGPVRLVCRWEDAGINTPWLPL